MTEQNIGDTGEDDFRSLCSKAGLMVTTPDRDRRGWDFLISFNEDPNDTETLDRRQAPPFCFVQLKTTRRKKPIAEVKISSLEKLAKINAPAFVILLVQNEQGEISEIYLMHMIGSRLKQVLQRLRKLEAASEKDTITRRKVNFNPTNLEKIEPTPDGLKNAILKSIGPSAEEYHKNKFDELRTMGYEPGQGLLHTTLSGQSIEDIEDAFLGLGQASITNFEQRDTRFDITITSEHNNPSSLKVIPLTTAKCLLVVEWEYLRHPLAQRMSIITANVLVGRIAIRLFDTFISLIIRPDEHGFHFSYRITADVSAWTIEKWVDKWAIASALTSGKATLIIRSLEDDPRFTILFSPDNHDDQAHSTAFNNLQMAIVLDLVTRHAACDPEAVFDYDVFLAACKMADILRQLIFLKAWIPTSALDQQGSDPADGDLALIYGTISIGSMNLGWAGTASFSSNMHNDDNKDNASRHAHSGLEKFTFLSAKRVDAESTLLAVFCENLISKHGIKSAFKINADKF